MDDLVCDNVLGCVVLGLLSPERVSASSPCHPLGENYFLKKTMAEASMTI